MAATPDFVEKNPDAIVAYLKAWLDVKKDFKENPKKVSDVIYSFFTSKGYKMDPKTFDKAMGRVDGRSGLPERSRALPDATRRGAAPGEEDFGDAGLEEGAADRLHGQGARRVLTAKQALAYDDRAGVRMPAFCFWGLPSPARNALNVLPRGQVRW